MSAQFQRRYQDTTVPSQSPYQVSLAWKGAVQGELSAGSRPALLGGPPPALGGQDSWWSPEHLLLGSASLSLMTTFTSLATKEKLEILDYQCEAKGVLEKTSRGPILTSITLSVTLSVSREDVERARQILSNAERACLISNSLKTPVILCAEVVGRSASSFSNKAPEW